MKKLSKTFVSKKPNYTGKKTIAATIALVLMLLFSTTIMIFPFVNASDPPRTWPTFSYVIATPNPVGVGQQVGVMMMLDKVHPTAEGNDQDPCRNKRSG